MLKSLARQLIGWLDRVVDADERVVCAVCDQRFHGFEEGSMHVRMAHPQYVLGGWQPAPVAASSATSRPGSFPLGQPAYAFRSN